MKNKAQLIGTTSILLSLISCSDDNLTSHLAAPSPHVNEYYRGTVDQTDPEAGPDLNLTSDVTSTWHKGTLRFAPQKICDKSLATICYQLNTATEVIYLAFDFSVIKQDLVTKLTKDEATVFVKGLDNQIYKIGAKKSLTYTLVKKIKQDLTMTYYPSTNLDAQGFELRNGQRYLRIQAFVGGTGNLSLVKLAADSSVTDVGFVDNLNENSISFYNYVVGLGLGVHPGIYGYSPHSFKCDLRLFSEDDPAHPECHVCKDTANTGALCPDTCNYCDTEFIRAFSIKKRSYPGVNGIGHTMDEPSSHYSFLDPRAFVMHRVAKEELPQTILGTGEFITCTVEKNENIGLWDLNDSQNYIDKNWCDQGARTRVKYAINYFRDSYFDMPIAESGFFDGQWKQRDDIQQLIGVMEYFRQESRKQVGSFMQISNDPSYDEIRSLFYAALGHQTRGIWLGTWNSPNDPKNPVIFGKVKNVVDELNNYGVIDDYLLGFGLNQYVKSAKPLVVDVSAFKSLKQFYLILINISKQTQNAVASFPKFDHKEVAEIIGGVDELIISKGQSSVTVTLAPHETKVLRWSLAAYNNPDALSADQNEK